ncbi:phage tail protein [Vibrio cholerae]
MNQNLKTVVTLGGTVDSSFGKIGSVFNSSMGKATKTVKELEREQAKLTKQIKTAKLAGADVGLLTRRYQQLSTELGKATEKAEAFEEAAGIGQRLRGIAVAGGVAIGSIWATGSALAGLVTMTNQQTAEMVGLAQSYDMSIDRFKAWSAIAKSAGLNGENIGDLIEELSNKFGEFKVLGEQSAVADVFGALGIDQAMLDGMAAADQFEFIMKRLEGVGDKQQAASLADMLFGGEGNKVVTYIRNTGQSINDLLREQRQFNLLTEYGAKGAKRYGDSFNNLTNVFTSAWQEISGILGGQFSGEIEALSVKFSTFVRENKTQIVGFIGSLVEGAKATTLALWNTGVAINSVAQALGGWETIGIAVASLMTGKLVVGLLGMVSAGVQAVKTITSIKGVMIGLNAVMTANPIGATVAAVAALVFAGIQLYRNWDAVVNWFSEKFNWFKTEFPATFGLLKTLFDYSPMGMIINNWSPILDFFKNLWGNVIGIVDSSIAKITRAWETVTGFMDSMKFWDEGNGDKVQPYQSATYNTPSRGVEAINNTYPASRGTTVHQTVGEIKVYAAAGQSPAEVAKAVHTQLGGHRSGYLYDLPEAY